MNIEDYRNYCIKKQGVTESFPFDKNTLVFKVMNKMFALTSVETFESINLKCEPELAIQLREEYHSVTSAFHMNKKHWNSVGNNGDIVDKEIYKLIDLSYDLVVNRLTKKLKEELKSI